MLSKQIVSLVVKEKKKHILLRAHAIWKAMWFGFKAKKKFNSTENASVLKEENIKLWTGGIITPKEEYRKNDGIERTKTKNHGN